MGWYADDVVGDAADVVGLVIAGSAFLERGLAASHATDVYARAAHRDRGLDAELRLAGGSVTDNAAGLVRRSGSLLFADTPQARNVLSTPGTLIRTWRGIKGAGHIPVVWGEIGTLSRSLGEIEVPFEDLGRRVARYRFVGGPRQSTPGATIPQQIQALWREAVPWMKWLDLTGDLTPCPDLVWEESRVDAILDLAAGIGARTWIRADGTVVLAPVPGIFSQPTRTIRSGVELADYTIESDLSECFNIVEAFSEHASGQAYRESYEDVESPTGTDARGPVVGYLPVSSVTSNAQCMVAAEAAVREMQGARTEAKYSMRLHPGDEAGDVHLVRAGRESHRLVLDTLSYDIFGAGATATGRTATLVRTQAGVS